MPSRKGANVKHVVFQCRIESADDTLEPFEHLPQHYFMHNQRQVQKTDAEQQPCGRAQVHTRMKVPKKWTFYFKTGMWKIQFRVLTNDGIKDIPLIRNWFMPINDLIKFSNNPFIVLYLRIFNCHQVL